MFTFATDYFLLVFIASLGVVQVGASMGQLKGLLVFKSPIIARTLGLGLVVGAFVLFFSTGTRNINDYEGGLNAPTQGLFFFLGSSAGVILTLLSTSILNRRMNGARPPSEPGLDALKDTNYLLALGRSLSYWGNRCQRQMRRYFSG